ncbi:MAG: hypothetical protein ACTSQJ_15005 [Promethearchaeota archaeon]
MLEKFKDLGKEDEKEDFPSFAWISLARRGMEKISLDQCFLEGCDNQDKNLLKVIKIEEEDNDKKHIKYIHIKCNKCGGTYQLKLETIKKVAKPKNVDKGQEADNQALSMGIVFILDKDGNNLGHLGYF